MSVAGISTHKVTRINFATQLTRVDYLVLNMVSNQYNVHTVGVGYIICLPSFKTRYPPKKVGMILRMRQCTVRSSFFFVTAGSCHEAVRKNGKLRPNHGKLN